MSVTLVHYFHTKVGTVDNVTPSVNYATLRVYYRLVEVDFGPIGFPMERTISSSLAVASLQDARMASLCDARLESWALTCGYCWDSRTSL